MFERPQGGARALLVHLQFGPGKDEHAGAEFRELVTSVGAEVCGFVHGRRRAPDPRLFCGKGKAAEIAEGVAGEGAELVVFNHDLSPSQERNLEALLQCRVLGRTGLILDIFAQRARTHEGKLQVELAQLGYLSTRLVRGWSHLERQRGGIGLRGPGETQLETDRRLLAQRVKHLRARLQKVRSQRGQSRASRQKHGVPLVAMVGYTNAGKSTLFNALTGADAHVANQLFATLDPTLRRLDLGLGCIVLADTVGFIRDLPHGLVESFRATLEETRQAQMLLHVVDAADPQRSERIEQVQSVLDEIGAGKVPQILVYNKTDLCAKSAPRVVRNGQGQTTRVHVSAMDGTGLPELRKVLGRHFFGQVIERELRLPQSAGRLRARLFALGAVRSERYAPDGASILRIMLPPERLETLLANYPAGDLIAAAR